MDHDQAPAATSDPAPATRLDPTSAPVTVLGLGAMGATLARTFLKAGHPTIVWNRTTSRADDLVADGAVLADSVTQAVAASRLVVACVLDTPAMRHLLEPAQPALAGRALVNLSSSTPEQARETAGWATVHGALYLDGAIMVPTPMIATDDAMLLYSGSRAAFDAHRATLTTLGGATHYLGDDHALASLYDIGMLDIYFAGMTAYLHALAILGADGISAADFLPYGQGIVDVLHASLPGLSEHIDAGHYPGNEDTIAMELTAMEHIVETARARRVDPALPQLTIDLLQQAIDQGHGHDSFSRLIEQLRPPTQTAGPHRDSPAEMELGASC